MTPQTAVMYAAPLRPGTRDQVSALLKRMNAAPGVFDSDNAMLPFRKLDTVHFARALTVTDITSSDRAVYGLPTEGLPDYFVLAADIDGEEPDFRRQLAAIVGDGFHEVLACCEGYAGEDIFAWLTRSRVQAAANYVNWVGRSVLQVREEEDLRRTLTSYARDHHDTLKELPPEQARRQLADHVRQQQSDGMLRLTPEAPTPLGWQLRNLANLLLVPLFLLLLLPLLLILSPLLAWQIRHWEKTDPPIAPPVSPAQAEQLMALENHDVTNQFSVFGSFKPGVLRRWLVRLYLLVTDYAARHVFRRGHLARVSTIHFARWVPLENSQRALFFSNYDGSLESYMDDFINKVGFGLNITFGNGIGYPRTRWVVLDGCSDEQVFKRILRRHQLPTEAWYNATPGISASNKHRNMLIREGVERDSMTDADARAWLALL